MANSQPAGQAMMTTREEEVVNFVLRDFSQKNNNRYVFGSHWEEVSEVLLPTFRNTFQYGNVNWPGQKKTDRQVDATGMLALSRFGAICDSLMTPSNSFWHGLEADNEYVMKDRLTRLWYEQVTRIMFKYRYLPEANFIAQNQSKYISIGAFGNTAIFTDELDPFMTGRRGIRYKAVPMGELFFGENHQGMVDNITRWLRMTARQVMQKWPDNFPEQLRPALEQGSEQLFDILHYVGPNVQYEAGRLDVNGKKFISWYVCMNSKTLLQEGGYRTFPYDVLRYNQAPGEIYARGPAMDVLPALKTLNAEKRTFLKQGHRAADPVLLTYDDGLLSPDLTPGAVNAGGMSSDGKPLIGVLPTGQIQVSFDMMKEERELINDAFLVTLFQILTETPQMSATEVIERTNEKGILMAPTVGRLRPDGMIDRELDILLNLGLLPPMPPRLREAQKAGAVIHRTVHTSPLSKMMQAQEAAGFFRTIEGAKELVAVTGDNSILDAFDFNSAMRGIAEIQSVRESWMADDKAIAAKQKNRAEAARQENMIKAAPAAAALQKARMQSGGQLPSAPAQAPAAAGAPLGGA